MCLKIILYNMIHIMNQKVLMMSDRILNSFLNLKNMFFFKKGSSVFRIKKLFVVNSPKN